MSESQLRDRVQEVLSEADASSGAIVSGNESDDEDGSAETNLLETAAEANEILESADPDELLAALGLDTLEDGTEPDSIPAAIARGKQENVEDLQRLLRLSKLADRADDGGLEGAVGNLRETIDEQAESDAEAAESTTGDDERDEASATDEDESDTAERDEGESTASDDAESEPDDDIGDRLRSAMSDSFASFGDEVSQLKERLEAASAGNADTEPTADADGAAGADADADAAADEETAADEEADEDEGLLGGGLGGDEKRGTASGGPSRHSTMAPPPSQRADMRTTRHSTMPDKHG